MTLTLDKKTVSKFFTAYTKVKPKNITLERWETHIERGRQIIELRMAGKSLTETAKLLEVSGERVRQIELDIIKKIKSFIKR